MPIRRVPDFVPGAPEPLFGIDAIQDSWDVHPDGRFLIVQNVAAVYAGAYADPASEPRYLVVLIWFTALEERLGRRR